MEKNQYERFSMKFIIIVYNNVRQARCLLVYARHFKSSFL